MTLDLLNADITTCRRCKRLVKCCERAATDPPKRYEGHSYWAKPITGFGDPKAKLLVLGLAPAAHGAMLDAVLARTREAISI